MDESPAAPAGGARKILLADGNRLHQRIAARLLEAEGYQVTIAATGDQALAALRQNIFDLILIEAEMLETTGFEAAVLIREHKASEKGKIPIVAMTSNAIHGERCVAAGADQYIARPLILDELRRASASMLSPANEKPVFDQVAALSRLGGDQAFLCTLASMFIEDSPALVAEMRAAVELQDGNRLARAAHLLKGAACPFSASAVTDSAQALESIGQSGQLATAKAEFHQFEAEIDRLLTALVLLQPRDNTQTSPNLAVLAGSKGTISCTA